MEHQTVSKTQGTVSKNSQVQKQPARSPAAQHPMLDLQRSIGNQAMLRLIRSRYIQPKLQVGPPNDHYEQEADRVADTVMRMPDPHLNSGPTISNRTQISRIHRKCTECEEEMQRQPLEQEEEPLEPQPVKEEEKPLQRQSLEEEEEPLEPQPVKEEEKPLQRQSLEEEEEPLQRQPVKEEEEEETELPKTMPVQTSLIQRFCSDCSTALQRSPTGSGARAAPSIVHEILRSPGQPLDASTRAFMEPRFGHDFSRVRVHTGVKAAESAQAVNARSYAVRGHLVFGRGEYSPGSAGGMRLLAHELAHVVQQGEAPDMPARLTDHSAGSKFAGSHASDNPASFESRAGSQPHSGLGRSFTAACYKAGAKEGEEEPKPPARTYLIQRSATARDVVQRTVTNLAVAGAPAEATVANHFISPRGAGAVVITATTSAPGQAVTWTGGGPQPGNPLQRRVPTATARTTTVTADTPADPGSQTVDIHVVNGRAAPANVPATLSFSRQAGVPPGFPPAPGVFGLTDVRTNNPTARIRAFVAGNQWAFQVQRISHRFLMAVASALINIPTAASATQANHCQVIAEFTPTGATTPPPHGTFWSRPIIQAHEDAHVARFYSPPFWEAFMRTAEGTIEAAASNVNVDHTIPATMSDTGVVGANAAAHQAILDAEHANADAAEIPGSEAFAHGQSNPMWLTLNAQIAARFRPLAPTGLAAAATGPTSVQLDWVHNACNETEYRVYRRRGRGAFAQIATLPAGTITFTDTLAGLAADTDFSYQVTAFGVAGESARSNRADVHTPP